MNAILAMLREKIMNTILVISIGKTMNAILVTLIGQGNERYSSHINRTR